MRIKPIINTLFVLLLSYPSAAKVVLHPLFSDNMVLQQKDNAPIWGSANAHSDVTVLTSWDNKKYMVKTDAEGNWKVNVSTPVAGGPYTITFTDSELLKLENVMIGEVWLCSGQSNMEMPLAGWGKINHYEQEIAAANFPNIRLLQVEKAADTKPQNTLKVSNNGWQPCSPSTVATFSSVAYFFARDIHQSRNIPIGLIHSSWSGTVAEAWVSGSSLKRMPAFAKTVNLYEKLSISEEELAKRYTQRLKNWVAESMTKDPGFESGNPIWAAADYNHDDWKTMQLPTYWEYADLPNVDGVVWFRKRVIIPAALAGKDLSLYLGTIDENDITWFNGIEVGRTVGKDKMRSYMIPGKAVKAGENVITVRVTDTGGAGGIFDTSKPLTLSATDGASIPISGEWLYKLADLPAVPKPENSKNRPTVLFNAMINPIVPYAIRGVIWYQGEGNATRAQQYQELFPLLINDWREKWERGDFPFLFVQLAGYTKIKAEPEDADWARLREAQLKTLALPNTGMAVAIDIGEEKDIHPKNKQDVGKRLALVARAKVYGEKIPYSGPVFKSLKAENDKLTVFFKSMDGGLNVKGDKDLKGFAIAGEDKKFYWANAVIKGDKVVLWSPQVSKPIAVRYAWAAFPVCNLYNGAGLPASPFRTDSW